MKVVVVIGTFKALEYARKAAVSALAHTPDPHVVIFDDATPEPEYTKHDWSKWPKDLIYRQRFNKNKGVTRSWGQGLRWARDRGAIYTVIANSDVLFTPGWFDGIEWALNNGVDLAGPITNAPGHQDRQRISHFLDGKYKASDDPEKLAEVARLLAEKHPQVYKPMRINGFCMAAKTSVWFANAHSEGHVFDPKHAMIRNEDEFQGRLSKKDMVSAAVPSSFVFHYRGVSRKGATHGKQGMGWYRPGKTEKKSKGKK